MFDILISIALGLVPAAPVYFVARTIFDKRLGASLNSLEAAPAQKQVEQKSKGKKKELSPSPIVVNHQKWAKRPSNFPLVVGGKKVLETISSLSALKLSIEDQHNLEVLSNQTDELLNTFVSTPASIADIPEVQKELEAQLVQIVKGVDNIKAQGTESLRRELKAGTDFLKMKFEQDESLGLT